MTEQGQPPRKIGFLNMTPERRREVARKGGKAAQKKGTAHRWNAREGRAAGRIGGWVRAKRMRDAKLKKAG